MEEETEDDILPSQELLRASLKSPMMKIKKKKPAAKLGLFPCDVCGKVFKERSGLTSHMAVHMDTADFECLKCPYKAKTKKYLQRHMNKVHTKPTKYECEDCGKKFHFQNRLTDHRRVHTGEKPFKCQYCDKAFSATYSLRTHQLIHTDEKPFKCSFCDYACRDSSTLRKHQHRHMGLETLYQCKKCDKSFKQKYKLKNHIAVDHLKMTLARYKCDQCESDFKTKSGRTLHIKNVHRKVMRCECKICGMILNCKYNLARHLRVHTMARPYVCEFDQCQKKFKDRSSMNKHTIIHYPSKQTPCKVCGKLFKRPRRLEYHIMTQHTAKVKNVKCGECGVCFYSKVYLHRHYQRIHLKRTKVYNCDLCDFYTTNKPSLVMHLKYGQHKERPLICKICNIKFKKHEYLKIHFTRKHNVRYKRMWTRKKKPKKPRLLIKEEPEDAVEILDSIDLLKSIKQEKDKEREGAQTDRSTVEADTILYSDAVFSEDVAKSYIKHNSEKLTKLPEDVFDTFFIEHVYRRYLEKEAKVSDLDKEEEERGLRRYRELLSEIIGGTEMACDTARIEDKLIEKTAHNGEKITQIVNKRNNADRQTDNVSNTQLDLHKCYVCFKIFKTKSQLAEHRSQHKCVRNEKFKKCPLCNYATTGQDFEKHMKEVHTMKISHNYGAIREEKGLTKTKLVRMGNKWVVQKEISMEGYVIPELKGDYPEELREKYKECKRSGQKMLFPCKFCNKTCKSMSALILHLRKHKIQPKSYKKRVWNNAVGKESNDVLIDGKCLRIILKDCMKSNDVRKSVGDREKRLYDPLADPKQVTKDCVKSNNVRNSTEDKEKRLWDSAYPKQITKDYMKLNYVRKSVGDSEKRLWDPFADPKPITKDCMKANDVRKSTGISEKRLWDSAYPKPITKDCIKSNNVSSSVGDREKRLWEPLLNPKPITKDCMKSNDMRKSVGDGGKRLWDSAIPKPITEDCMKANDVRKSVGDREKRLWDPLADPKPITAKHRCDKQLIDFYKNNIKGGDIDFGQFLKIFNKISKDGTNTEDFNQQDKVDVKDRATGNGIKCREVAKEKPTEESVTKEKIVNRKVDKSSFKRVVMLSKREYNRRNELKKRMREKMLN